MTRPDPTLTLDVLGAGPAYTDRAGATGAAYLVRSGSVAIVLDLGQAPSRDSPASSSRARSTPSS